MRSKSNKNLLLAAAYDAKGIKEHSRNAVKKALEKNKNLPDEKQEQQMPINIQRFENK